MNCTCGEGFETTLSAEGSELLDAVKKVKKSKSQRKKVPVKTTKDDRRLSSAKSR